METDNYALKYSQSGLADLTRHMIFFSVHLHPENLSEDQTLNVYNRLKEIAGELRCSTNLEGEKRMAIVGVAPGIWETWCRLTGRSVPRAMNDDDMQSLKRVLNVSPPYFFSGGHLYFHIKADTSEGAEGLKSRIQERFSDLIAENEVTRGNAYREGYVYGRRILHGLIRSVDPYNLSARVLTGDDDPEHKGACYCLTQRFLHDWDAIGRMSETAIENMIGRDHEGNLVPDTYERSHLKRARVLDHSGINYRILTQGQPFGNEPGEHSRESGVYVSAYAQSVKAFSAVLGSMLGKEERFIMDEHFTVSASNQGNIWYVPTLSELDLPLSEEKISVPINPFFKKRSANGFMYYNTKDFLYNMGCQPAAEDQPLSARIMELLGNTFSRWHNNWYHPLSYPDLGHLKDHISPDEFARASVAEKKGLSIKIMLGEQLSGPLGIKARLFRIDPKEIIVGVVPPFTLGTGIRIMRYLTEAELLEGYFLALDETSMAGHIVPSYSILAQKGIGALLKEAEHGAGTAVSEKKEDERRFYQSAAFALAGVQQWFNQWAQLARKERDALSPTQTFERENLNGISTRMEKLAQDPPENFIEAVQLIFGVHCCLHLIGELVSLGRIDQVLGEFFEKDTISETEAQEIIDAFWIKMDEQVMINRQNFPDDRTYGTCAVPYRGGANVPQGDKASQWVMQATVGGYLPTDGGTPKDGCNKVTRMCIRAARRLPLNSPCLSLRINPDTPDDIVAEAAGAILSGGAHPYLFNDDIVTRSLSKFGAGICVEDARDFCANGCWEPIFDGKSEFALTYVPVFNALEAALNRGATYISAGPTYLRGDNISFQSPPAEEIATFESFVDIFYRHYHWLAASTLNGFITCYGNLWKVCPSPLLSSLVEGCMDSGRDLTNGGARYHILAPMILGLPCVIDSLWAVKEMVFNPETAVTSLAELRDCLLCDWGYEMIEPLSNKEAGEIRADLVKQRYQQLRRIALSLPKFGGGHQEVDAFGGSVASHLAKVFTGILEAPESSVSPEFAERLNALGRRYDLPGRPFQFKLTPGFGTFEDYLGLGLAAGASADGRRKGATLSSNFSPMPSPSDLPPDRHPRNIFEALKGYNSSAFNEALNIFGPVDIDIPEDFSEKTLVEVLKAFARSELGFNILTISCCDLETMQQAVAYPERYDLIRQRMGGWTEFFVIMFPGHQEQHLRRPLFVS